MPVAIPTLFDHREWPESRRHALEATIGFPTPLVPEMQLFLRCPLGQRFLASMRDSGERVTPLTTDGDATVSSS